MYHMYEERDEGGNATIVHMNKTSGLHML